jgi:hypothetical protein
MTVHNLKIDLDYKRLVEIMEKSFDYPEDVLESEKATYREWDEYDFLCAVEDILRGEPEVIEIERSYELKPNEYFRENEMEVRRLLKSLRVPDESDVVG